MPDSSEETDPLGNPSEDFSKTTLIVIAIMCVGIAVMTGLGIMIGQNCARNKALNGDVRSGSGRQTGQASHNVQMTTTGETLPTTQPTWKEAEDGSEFISQGLSPKNNPSSAL